MEKKKISNSEELNKYYDIVNNKLKKFSEMNIPHNKVVSYLNPGSENFKRFISEDDNLKDVDGIEVVVKDVIHDIYHAFKDGLLRPMQKGAVKKFENLLMENILNISNVTRKEEFEHEKALADIFKVSMSYIDILNPHIHLYNVNDQGIDKKVLIFSTNEIVEIKKNIVKELVGFIRKRTTELLSDKKIELGELIEDNDNINSIVSGKISNEDVIEHIARHTGLEVDVKFEKTYTLDSVEYYIFQASHSK